MYLVNTMLRGNSTGGNGGATVVGGSAEMVNVAVAGNQAGQSAAQFCAHGWNGGGNLAVTTAYCGTTRRRSSGTSIH